MGVIDRSIRTVLAIIAGVLYFTGQISGWLACILSIFAVIFLLTSTIGFARFICC